MSASNLTATRRHRCAGAAATGWLAAIAVAGSIGVAQARFPERPIVLVVSSSPGAATDQTARLLARSLSDELATPVVVENRAGGRTRLATDYVSHAAPDGHTLLFVTGEAVIEHASHPDAKPSILDDFAPVSLVAVCDMVLVVKPALPTTDVAQLEARARAAPGTLNYSTAGVGTTMHLVGELFKQRTGTNIVHIPYKGSAASLTALVAGTIDVSFVSVPTAMPYILAGRVRPLAVASDVRSPQLPDVPTMKQSGVDGVNAQIWYGMLAPAGTPDDVVETLVKAVARISHSAAYTQTLTDIGVYPRPSTPTAFGQMLRDESAKWAAIIKSANIHIQ